MLRVVRELGNQYQQIVLIGHPFFLKDVIETGKNQGVKWHKMILRLMFGSEGFSEAWRDYILNLIGSKNPEDAISVYGSSEFLLIGYETKLSLEIRREVDKNRILVKKVFATDILPNIFQFNPLLRFIESVNRELILTANSGVPLIRFNLHDQGTIFRPKDLPPSLQKIKMKLKNSWQLPFLALWGRSDQTLIFYAANIYPEHIQASLQKPSLLKRLTGKFVMRLGEYKNLDKFLEINVELNNNVIPNKKLTKILQDEIVKKLLEVNMEYRFLTSHLEKDLVPKIKLWPYQSETFFKPGLKPKYIIKT
jgi:phenylacetate-CoA ligase